MRSAAEEFVTFGPEQVLPSSEGVFLGHCDNCMAEMNRADELPSKTQFFLSCLAAFSLSRCRPFRML